MSEIQDSDDTSAPRPEGGIRIGRSDRVSPRPPEPHARRRLDEPEAEPVTAAPAGGGGPPRGRRPFTWRRFLVYFGLSAAGAATIAALGVVIWIWSLTRDLPSLETLQNYTPPVTTRVYAGDGTLLGEYARERRIFVPIAFVPKRVIDAFTSAEDRNFFNHPGIDPGGILRAGVKDVFNVIEHRRLEGASTITQQVAKNFLLNSDVKFSRKIKEAILAIRIDATYPKDKILELYLNEIYLGENSYGVAAAALNYFGKSLDELDIAEVAFLAALPKAPSNYDPMRNNHGALERRNWVIGQMADNGYIADAEAKAAIAEPLVTRTRPMGSQAQDVDYYVEEVRRLLYSKYGKDKLYDGGLQVRASLDTRLQNAAVSALRSGLVRYDRRHGWRGATAHLDVASWKPALAAMPNQSGIDTWRLAAVLDYGDAKSVEIGLQDGSTGSIPFSEIAWARRQMPGMFLGPAVAKPQDVVAPGDVIYVEPDGKGGYGLRQVPQINGAIVVMDPHTGRVLAMSGGFSYASSQFDRAMQAMRQPGSAFKPFVYAAALDNGLTPSSQVLDAPIVVDQGAGLGLWHPANFSHKFLGPVTLRRAIALSLNNATARLAQDIGMDKIVPYPERFGVYDHLPPYLANALGSYETTLMRLTTGYAEFDNGGKKIAASLIDRIQDRNGNTIWRHDGRVCDGCNVGNWQNQSEPLLADPRQQIVDPRTAYQIVSLLEGVVQRGTGRSILAVGKPLAGKTGTSNEAKDLWFVGFSPDLACGVFVGFDNPRTLGKFEQGATVAAPIFRDFMKEALADVPPIPFRVAPGIELVQVDAITGQPTSAGDPNAIMEAYKAGTAPGEPNAPPNTVIGMSAAQEANQPTDVGEGTGGLY
ncbi:MAG: penicillin-binding protein 1A [Alphaproteobacteria bacterium]|nr:penicillin-binding protein 1A [Alphaproteobacteria bacterium]MBV9693605.1 penicillin-binding protein 1A [Alphaproteobacteria bacterium]